MSIKYPLQIWLIFFAKTNDTTFFPQIPELCHIFHIFMATLENMNYADNH